MLLAQFASADINGDGFLSFAEASAMIPGMTMRQFLTLDVNQDGMLSRDELERFIEENEPETPGGCFASKTTVQQSVQKFVGEFILLFMALGGMISLGRHFQGG